MVFSSRNTKLYFNFDFEGASLRDVELQRFELNWPQLNQTSDAYSKIGLINVI
jgi:hypothetical protein